MRYSASEKLEIIELVEQSTLSVARTLASIGIPRSTFYDWYGRYQDGGIEALEDGKPRPQRVWNKIPDEIGAAIVNLALDEPDLSPRELAVNFTDTKASFVSEASVYRLLKDHGLIASPAFILMKAADRFANPTTAPNQLWQTDFTYLKVIGWGWFYLSTVLDDFSRYILAWKLCTTMSAADVSDTLQLALKAAGLDQVNVLHRPRLLSDNGPSYVSSELGDWLKDKGIRHVRGRPYHPMTQGKIERYHRSMKNRILLENYYLPGQLELSIGEFVEYYNNRRYHESLDNLTPVDVYFGRGPAILRHETARVHHTARRCGGMAAHGARSAARGRAACWHTHAVFDRGSTSAASPGGAPPRAPAIGLERRPERGHRNPLGHEQSRHSPERRGIGCTRPRRHFRLRQHNYGSAHANRRRRCGADRVCARA